MTKEDFENSTKSWICENAYVHNDIKVRGHCQTTEKYKGSAYRDFNTNINLNHRVPVLFYNVINYDSHLIM